MESFTSKGFEAQSQKYLQDRVNPLFKRFLRDTLLDKPNPVDFIEYAKEWMKRENRGENKDHKPVIKFSNYEDALYNHGNISGLRSKMQVEGNNLLRRNEANNLVFRAMQASAGTKTSYEPANVKPGGVNLSSGSNYSVEELVRVLKEHPQFMTDTSGLYEYMSGSKNLYEMPAKSREGTDKDLQFDFTNSKNPIIDRSIKKPMNDRHSLIYLPSLLDLLNENLEMNRIFKENFLELRRQRDGEPPLRAGEGSKPSNKELEEELLRKERNLREQLQQELMKRENEAGRIKQDKDQKLDEMERRRREENERLSEMERQMSELRRRNEELERLLREKNASKPPVRQITPKQRPPSSKKSLSRPSSQGSVEPKEPGFDYSKGISIKENMVSGTLALNIVHGRGLLDNGANEPVDYYGVVVYPTGQRLRLRNIKNTPIPIWNQKELKNLSVDKELDQKVQIFFYSKESGIFSREKSIGFIDFPLNELLKTTNKWLVNKVFTVKGSQEMPRTAGHSILGYICLQAAFLNDPIEPSQEPKPAEDIKALLKKPSVSGNLIVHVCHLRNLSGGEQLRGSETGLDSYAVISFPNKQVFKTAVKKSNQNPVWNQKFGNNITVQEGSMPPLQVQVFSGQGSPEKDYLVGVCEIDLKSCYEKENEWSYNQYFDLRPAKITSSGPGLAGQIYLQIKFNGPGVSDDGKTPKMLESVDEMLKSGFVSGSLQVFIHYFNNLPLTWRQCIDPRIKVNLPTMQTLSSAVLPNKRASVINYNYKSSAFLNPNIPQEISVSIVDFEEEFGDDEVLGKVTLKANEALSNPQQWKMSGVYKLEIPSETSEKYPEGLKNEPGEIGLSLRFVPETVPDAKDLPKVIFDQGLILKTATDYEEEIVQGRLRLCIESAKDLLPITNPESQERKCNAYCQVHLPNGKTLSTKEVRGSNEPEWKKKFIEEIGVKRKLADHIDIEVFDKHEKGSDFIGMVRISMKKLFKYPCRWVVNGMVDMTDKIDPKKPPSVSVGRIYIQAKFIPQGFVDTQVYPERVESIELIDTQE